jgi:hypothetical protein
MVMEDLDKTHEDGQASACITQFEDFRNRLATFYFRVLRSLHLRLECFPRLILTTIIQII